MTINLVTLRKRIFTAFLFLIVEIGVLIWPVGLLREEAVDFLSGEGSYGLDGDYEEGVCQVFHSPLQGELKSIGIVLTSENSKSAVGSGKIRLLISDKNNEILVDREENYSEDSFDSYQDIEVNLQVKRNQQYWLTIVVGKDENGLTPAVKVCSKEYPLRENETLYFPSEIEGIQLVTRYTYVDALKVSKVWKGILLAMITAVFVAMPAAKDKKIQAIAGIVGFTAFPMLVGRRLEALNMVGEFYLPSAMRWNLLLMYLLEVLLILLAGSVRWGLLVSQTLLTAAYTVNYFMYLFRGMPFRANDLSAVGTAAKVVGGYDLTPNSHLAFAWALLLLIIAIEWKAKLTIRKIQIRGAVFLAGIAASLTAGYVLLNTEFLEDRGFYNLSGFQYLINYKFNGYLVATCMDIRNNKVVKPDGYSEKRVEEILSDNVKPENVQQEALPNVILIMNESFSDLRVLGNLQLNAENMQNIYGLRENAIHGYTNVSVLGGGTANSEFEALTGCSMGLLPASGYAYQQYVKKPMETLVSVMKEDGYKTYSIHPESSKNWNRDTIYQMFGFDESYWKSDFDGAEQFHSGVSDRATYYKIQELYEQKALEDRIFVFDVTMQNHGGYERQENEPEDTIYAENAKSEEADLYLSLIDESDKAFGELVQYFEKVPEKTIICMFGDHQPMFEEEGFYDQIYAQTDGLNETDKIFNQYKTPFIIWANYDIPEQNGIDISANYLGALLLENAGIPGNSYFNFLTKQMKDYPVITVNGYKDNKGNAFQWSGEGTEFLDYRILQYYELFD